MINRIIGISAYRARRNALRCDWVTGPSLNGIGWTERCRMPDGREAGLMIPVIRGDGDFSVWWRWQGWFHPDLQDGIWNHNMDAMEAIESTLIEAYAN